MTRLHISCLVLTCLLSAAPPVRAAFVIVDGLDPMERAGVSLAVVRVASVRPAGPPGCRGFTRTPCLGLQLVQPVHGAPPPPASLQDLPFGTMANTAWTEPPGPLLGALFLMAWVKGQPCGIGLSVSLGPHVLLPHALADASDPLVPATRAVLAASASTTRAARRAALERLLDSRDPAEARLADGALLGLDTGHARSARRYLMLLERVDLDPRAPGWRAEGMLLDAARVPVPLRPDAWAHWAGVPRDGPARFLAFRATVRHRLLTVARQTTARPTLRALALSRLAHAPVRLGVGDAFERSTADSLQVALKLTTGEVRREAFRTLHAHTKGRLGWDQHYTDVIRKALRAAIRAERSPAERRVLERILAGH